jgi:hypothetical protein
MSETNQADTTIFVQELDEQSNSLQVTPVDLSADGDCRVGQPASFALPPENDQNLTPRVVTASAGPRFYLARIDPRQPQRAVLKRFEAWQSDPEVATVELGELEPVSLLAIGDRCFLGAVGAILPFECGPDLPRPTTVVTGPAGAEPGAFDALCMAGDDLIAICDQLDSRTFWIVGQALGPQPRVRARCQMPHLQGERVREMSCAGKRLAVRTTFYHRGTAGQRLLLFDLAADAISIVAQAMEIRGAGLLKHGHARLAGRTHSPWQGLDLIGDLVLIGAAERGILVCRANMCDEDKALRVNPGGDCLDLKVSGDQILALVSRKKDGRGRVDLAVLAPADDPKEPLRVVTSHPLPGRPERITP